MVRDYEERQLEKERIIGCQDLVIKSDIESEMICWKEMIGKVGIKKKGGKDEPKMSIIRRAAMGKDDKDTK